MSAIRRPMGWLWLALLIMTMGTASGASAQPLVDEDKLDTLFAQLAVAPDAERADGIADQIWMTWLSPTDPALSGMMEGVAALTRTGAYPAAIAMLDRVVERWPDYAEGWNRRATLYFMTGDYEASLADVAQTLEREPRHFGALSGKAIILLRLGREDEARDTIIKALEIHPFLSERALFEDLPPPMTRA